MINKLLGGVFRAAIKLIFVIGAWWYFISGIWGHDITLDTFDHIFRCFTIICCIARFCSGIGEFNQTGRVSLRHLVGYVIICILGAVVGHFLYGYVVKPVLVFLGKLIGGLLVICVGLYIVLMPALTAASQAASLAAMGTGAVASMIQRGDLKLDASQQRLKDELYHQAGVDYDKERKVYEDDMRRHGWE